MKKLFYLVLILTCSAHADELQEFVQNTQSLRAHFTQTLLDNRGAVLENSRGEVELQRPNRFRWSYQHPYQQLIISDGKQVWIYEEDLQQVTLKNYHGTIQNAPALLLSGDRPLDEVFVITPLSGDLPGVFQYQLAPKETEGQFSRMFLSVHNKLLQKLILEDNLGQTSVIEFTQQEVNPEIPGSQFQFTPPDGTDIIDGRE